VLGDPQGDAVAPVPCENVTVSEDDVFECVRWQPVLANYFHAVVHSGLRHLRAGCGRMRQWLGELRWNNTRSMKSNAQSAKHQHQRDSIVPMCINAARLRFKRGISTWSSVRLSVAAGERESCCCCCCCCSGGRGDQAADAMHGTGSQTTTIELVFCAAVAHAACSHAQDVFGGAPRGCAPLWHVTHQSLGLLPSSHTKMKPRQLLLATLSQFFMCFTTLDNLQAATAEEACLLLRACGCA
jgi:hypothetical protein